MKAWIRAGICFSLALMLILLITSNTLSLLINPGMQWLVLISILLLACLGIIQLWMLREKELHRSSWFGYVMLFIPLFLFFFAPPKALDASIGEKKGVSFKNTKPAAASQQQIVNDLEDPYKKIKNQMLKQQVIILNDEQYIDYIDTMNFYPKEFAGKKVKIRGFVYRDETIGKNQFVVGRFAVTCCTADASVVGLLVQSKKAKQIKTNEWIEVTGTIQVTNYDGSELPMVRLESYKKIHPPKDPYVYPSP